MTPIRFRADHIGSLLRPASLLDLRRQHAAGRASASDLHAAEDKAIRDVVSLQENAGLPVVTDGELRRRSYHSYFFAHLGDIVPDHVPPDEVAPVGGAPKRAAQPVAKIGSRIQRSKPIHVEDFRFLSSLTKRVAKITIPGPCALHFRGGDAAALATAYTDLDAYWNDIGTIPELLSANFGALEGKIELALDGLERSPGVWAPESLALDGIECKAPVLIGESCSIGEGASLEGPLVVAPGSVIGSGARVVRSVLTEGSEVPAQGFAVGAVLGRDTGS